MYHGNYLTEKIVKKLLNQINKIGNKKHRVQYIIEDNNLEAFTKYLKNNDPSENDSIVFTAACEYNRLDMVKLLIEDNRINPLNRELAAIYDAFNKNNKEMMDLLLTHPKVVEYIVEENDMLYMFYKEEIIKLKLNNF